ncbi:hypothetical protein AVEN_102612-1 [Araneus ventricosus]|uniref:Uncharacterized protein n=1 Tax=Araneus ventricosus TaxID=182803 RepID=A0A4Y2BL08_ARAVE|nr:hypothetical protein AVEN_102612-1 [Araneus ventricosus]
MLGHPLCTNLAITKLFVYYVMHSSFAYREFNNNFRCGDPTILPYEFIHSRCTVDNNVSLPRACPTHNADTTGIWCTVRDTALRTPLSSCDKFVMHVPLLREEIG